MTVFRGGGSEPLIVEGVLDITSFTPNEGQPTKNEAVSAFSSGKIVMIKYIDEDDVEDTAICTALYQGDLYFSGQSTITW